MLINIVKSRDVIGSPRPPIWQNLSPFYPILYYYENTLNPGFLTLALLGVYDLLEASIVYRLTTKVKGSKFAQDS